MAKEADCRSCVYYRRCNGVDYCEARHKVINYYVGYCRRYMPKQLVDPRETLTPYIEVKANS